MNVNREGIKKYFAFFEVDISEHKIWFHDIYRHIFQNSYIRFSFYHTHENNEDEIWNISNYFESIKWQKLWIISNNFLKLLKIMKILIIF